MSNIYVFSGNDADNDYSTMGLVGALTPSEAIFREEANGESVVELTHPLDEWGRYTALKEGNILVASVPARTTPEIQDEAVVTTVWTYVVKDPAVLSHEKLRKLYKEKDGTSSYETLKGGDKVTVTWKQTEGSGEEEVKRWKVKAPSGQEGYMYPDALTLVTEHHTADNSQAIEEINPAWSSRPQLFRIYEADKGLDSVKVTARHISYDLLYNITSYKSDEVAELQTVLTGILSNTYASHKFTAKTNVRNTRAGLNWRGKTPIDAFFDPEEGVCKKFDVSIVRDNFNLFFLHDPGVNRGITIEYAKNMTGVSYKENWDEVVTRVVPVGQTKKGEPLYLEGTAYVDSPYISNYPVIKVHYLECENCKVGDKDEGGSTITETIARARMRAQAEALFAPDDADRADEPKIEMEVEFQNLGDTEEYAQFKGLETCFLYDYVRVSFIQNGINKVARVTEIEWDLLLDKIKSIKIGKVMNKMATAGVANWQVPTGLDGRKIANGTTSETILSAQAQTNLSESAYAAQEEKLTDMIAGTIAKDAMYNNISAIAETTEYYGKQIPASSNLNNYTKTGRFWAALTDVPSISNSPTDKGYSLLVFRTDESNLSWARTIQIAQELASPYGVYIRVGINGWKEWRKIAESSDITSAISDAEDYADLKVAGALNDAKTWAGNSEANVYQLGYTSGSNTLTVTGSNNETHNGFAVLIKRSYTTYAMIMVDLWTQNIGVIGKLPSGIKIVKDAGNTSTIKIQNGVGAAVICIGLNCTFEADSTTATLTENVTRYNYAETLSTDAETSAKAYTDVKVADKIDIYGTELASTDDLNDFKTSGHYFSTTANSSLIGHSPTSTGFVLLIFRGDSSDTYQRTVQMAFEVNSPYRTYIREHTTGVWRDWQTILYASDTANNLTTTTSGKVLDARQGKALADDITPRATVDKVRTTMRIGGRNLIFDSKEMNRTATDGTTWRTANGQGTASRYIGTDKFYRMKLECSGYTGEANVSAYAPNVSLGSDWVGKKLTFSCDIWANNWANVDDGVRIYFAINAGNTNWTYYSDGRLICQIGTAAWGDHIVAEKTCHSQQWLRIATTIELTEANFPNGSHSGVNFSDMTTVFAFIRLKQNGDVRFCKAKLEWGEIDTDWTPAIEDTGVVEWKSPNGITAADSTVTNLESITLEQGMYVLQGVASFGTNANGYRQIGFGTNASSSNADRYLITKVGANPNDTTVVSLTSPLEITSQTTYYLNCYQNSGSSLTVTGGIRCVQIR